MAQDIKGSRSWLALGPLRIQPAEFSKFITAFALAKVMSHPQFQLKSLQSYAVVAVMIFWSGIKAGKETLDPLLGTPPAPEYVECIRDLVMAHEEICGIHDLFVKNESIAY